MDEKVDVIGEFTKRYLCSVASFGDEVFLCVTADHTMEDQSLRIKVDREDGEVLHSIISKYLDIVLDDPEDKFYVSTTEKGEELKEGPVQLSWTLPLR